MRPADYTFVAAHGGRGQETGPHMSIGFNESLDFYPGGLVTQVCGCMAADLRRETVSAAETYLLGRSNAILVLSNAKSEGGANPMQHVGWLQELLAFCPHFGPVHSYLLDLRGRDWDYLNTGFIMLGNPFVAWNKNLSAPSVTVTGKLVAADANADLHGFYVTATRDGKSRGRVKTDRLGHYRLACLPGGNYEIALHFNALQKRVRKIVSVPGDRVALDFDVPQLWCVRGQVLDPNGQTNSRTWAEIASRPTRNDFAANDVFGIPNDENGRFTLRGIDELTFWLRGATGMKYRSEPQQITVRPGQSIADVQLRPGMTREARQSVLRGTAEDFLALEQLISIPTDTNRSLPGLTDVVEVRFGLIADSERDPFIKKTGLHREFRDRAMGPHALRIAFRLRDPMPDVPPDHPLRYSWRVVADPRRQLTHPTIQHPEAEFTIVHRFLHNNARWKTVPPNWPGDDPRVWFSHPFLADNWVIFDVTAFGGNEELDWRLLLLAYAERDGTKWLETVPKPGWFHVRAFLGDEASLDAAVVDPAHAKDR